MRDEAWIAERTGPLGVRRMSVALRGIARLVGASDELALDRIARREDPFHVLVACIISLRTLDEVTCVAAPRLLAVAPDPARLARLPEARIARLVYPAGFYRTKARSLRRLARVLLEEHGGQVPDELDALVALPGVGRKTANLVLTLGHGRPGICVDVHVHRISNRLGFVRTRAPDETEQVLRALLPRRYWIPVNGLLVSFGREVCRPVSPRCSGCPVRRTCGRVGVTTSR